MKLNSQFFFFLWIRDKIIIENSLSIENAPDKINRK